MTMTTLPEASHFRFADLTRVTEERLVRDLGLEPLELDDEMVHCVGIWRDAPVTIETRAYRSDRVHYARFAVVLGQGMEIGNVLCLPGPTLPVPIFGADLVAVRRDLAMIAADLSPTLPSGPERERQLAGIAARRTSSPALPSGGELPAWAAERFSPHTLYTRITPDDLPLAVDAFHAYPDAFIEGVTTTDPRPALSIQIAGAQDAYMTAHRVDDKGLGLLRKMFGAAWADRYLTDVLFPASAA